MVGNGRLVLEEVLTEKQIYHILKQTSSENVTCHLKGTEVRPAVDGLAGFLGDHMKAILHVDVQGEAKKVHLFIKRMPVGNVDKAKLIDEGNFYRREMLMFQLLEEISGDDPNPWCVKAYIYTESIFVMPDLSLDGYSNRHYLDTLDLEHILLTTTSIARFHAAFVNYEVKKSIELRRPYNTFEEFGHVLTEPHYCDSPWVRACSKVSVKLVHFFSTEPYRNLPDLEAKLTKTYLQACDSLTEYKDTVNVLIHKDLWLNNIMFKYENDAPINAVLVDYQLLRYAPPAFDIMHFLYLTTDRRFRQEKEMDIFNHYYSIFDKNLNDDSKKKLNSLHYDRADFIQWCEKARMFGILEAIAGLPFILMDPKTAQETFDNPETSKKHFYEDRSEPVTAYAHNCKIYKHRNLEVTEEFIEKYVLRQL